MTFNTKAFAAQDALVTALKATPALSAWTIDFGLPPIRDEQHIWIDEQVSEWNQDTATTGLVARSENFRLSVYIYDRKTGADALEIRQEIEVAASAISDAIASQPFLGGVVLFAQIVGGEYEGAFYDTNASSREGALLLTIECQAFLA